MTNRSNAVFAALSDPTRRAVIERLVQGPAPVSELHAPHQIALPTFLRHLHVLEAAQLVQTQKQGRVRIVTLAPEPLAAVEDWLNTLHRQWGARLDQLDALAQTLDGPEPRGSHDKP